MLPAFTRHRSLLLASVTAFLPNAAFAQTSPQSQLPPVTVDAPQSKRTTAARPAQPAATRSARVQRVAPAPKPQPSTTEPTATGLATPAGASLTVPTIEQARAIIDRIPGGVEVVPDTVYKNGPANTIRDVLGWVPGVLTQTRWGPDGRVSIRGSGLSRSFGNRGINPFMDGIPINTADGLFDLFEIDPTSYRYVEVTRAPTHCAMGLIRSVARSILSCRPAGMHLHSKRVSMWAALAM
ncbi:MAG TPA: TonB-dependent receptor plug domain-containing protein [Pseudolabrys sp.]|nr:TonB-dependent receptor plug domain-containing protein [Pseudolabrys sp.]